MFSGKRGIPLVSFGFAPESLPIEPCMEYRLRELVGSGTCTFGYDLYLMMIHEGLNNDTESAMLCLLT